MSGRHDAANQLLKSIMLKTHHQNNKFICIQVSACISS